MAKRNIHSLKKYQNDLKRQKKAKEKMDRRQGKKDFAIKDVDEQKSPD